MRIACVFVPDLSLQAALRAYGEDGDTPRPAALVEPRRGVFCVLSCNAIAQETGVRVGMTTTTARSLCAALLLMEHCADRAVEALEALADGLGVFSPKVFLSVPDAVFVDLMGLKNVEKIAERALVQAAGALGFRVQTAVAHHSFSARALASVRTQPTPFNAIREQRVVASLPLEAARLPLDVQKAMHVVGIRTIGEFVELPPAAIARRFGVAVRTIWQQASGRSPLPMVPYRPLRPVMERMIPDDPVHRLDQLSFCLKILIDRALQRVKGRGRGVEEVTVVLRVASVSGDSSTSSLRRILDLGRPTSDGSLLLQILRERFATTPPTGPVEELALTVSREASLGTVQLELFGSRAPAEAMPITALRLTSLLRGEQRFLAILREDYRPENAYSLVPFEEPSATAPCGLSAGQRPVRLLPSPVRLSTISSNEPKPPRGVVSGPERLQGGWWDGRPIARDYWVVDDEVGVRSWIFRDRRSGHWYVHGTFD
jgi:protein ImuB